MFKNALDITKLYLKTTYNERGVLIFQLIMPLVFIFLIGQAIGGFGPGGSSSTNVTWTLAVANEDAGDLGAALVDTLAADPTLEIMAVSADDMAATVENEEAEAGLLIPANFSDELQTGNSLTLDFYSDPDNVQFVQPVEQAVLGGMSQLTGSVSSAVISRDVAAELGLFELGVDEADYFATAVADAQSKWEAPPVTIQVNEDEIVVDNNNIIPQGLNQSSPGMMAMFATFGMIGGAAVLIQERQSGTLRRLLVMPITKASILVGKLLGIMLAGVLQMSLLIVVSTLVFDVPWGNSPGALVLMILTFALAITSLSMMMAALTKTLAQANALGTVIVLSISALGGAWWPLDIVPGWMQSVGRLSPMSWAMDGFQDIITRGLGVTAVLPEVGVLLAFAAVFMFVGIWRFRYE
ncbi:ABC transporter permease [Candidatus Leptofilum sp.]|uniref:ABC transporter permease n=1 Tax=Candidatus Leptofilum sp. TaxID=3241576 RepID=UPI003B5A8BB6